MMVLARNVVKMWSMCTFLAKKTCYIKVTEATHSTWLELMALMSYYFARLWKHISSIFGTIGRREHIQRFLTILRNFGMREPINGILNTSLLEIKGRLYRLLHIINEFSHLRIHSFPLINIPS
jgi:GR25 family glycosyltransferase involved in LPS biosynthesis